MNIEIDKFETEQVPIEEEIKKEDNEQTKKRRGRPRKNNNEEFEQTQPNVNINFDFIFDIVVERLPNKVPLNDSERKNLNDVTNAIVNKYLPMVAGYDIEISFILVVSSVILPRLQKPKNEQTETIETTENEKA
jgi:hypothetical protein